MNSNRKTAIIVGILFITATVTSSLYYVLVAPLLGGPDYLVNISKNANQVIIGVLLYLIDCAAVVAIPIALFPILKKQNESLALGYVASRMIESITIIVGLISLLALLTLSQDHLEGGASDASHLHASGALLLSVIDRALLLGVEFVFSLTALILNYLLYRSKFVPRFISVWGLIGATLLLVSGFLVLLGLSQNPTSVVSMLLSIPIALQEMVFAIWLIGKGFNPSVKQS